MKETLLGERAFLEKAVAAFPKKRGLAIEIEMAETGDPGWDGCVVFESESGTRTSYRVEVKRNCYPATLPLLERQWREGGNRLFVTSYVSPGLAESLRVRQIEFIDLVGNTYVDMPGMYVFVNSCRKPVAQLGGKSSPLFHAAGVKAIFVCLSEVVNGGERVSGSLVDNLTALSEAAGISLGSASNVRKGLIEKGYLDRDSEGAFILIQRDELLESWARAYAERLMHRIALGRFHAPQREWWRKTNVDGETSLWGGEVAAMKLTKQLSPQLCTVYIRGNPNLFINRTGLQPDPSGEVLINEVFWSGSRFRQGVCVHPLLVYADLLATDDARNHEAAKLIYKEFIARAIESS